MPYTPPTTNHSQGEELHGQQYDPRMGIVMPFEWQKTTMGVNMGEAATDLDVVSKDLNLRKTWDIVAIQAALDATSERSAITKDQIEVPDELAALEIIWTKDEADGETQSDWNGRASGYSYSLSGSENASGHASVGVLPELLWNRKEFYTAGVWVDVWEFYLPTTAVKADVLAKVSTLKGVSVLAWPSFRPVALTFVLSGGKVSGRVDVSASAGQSYSLNSDDTENKMWDATKGWGKSKDINLDVRVQNLPPMLMSTRFLNNATENASASVDAAVGWIGDNFPTVTVNKALNVEVQGSVSPSVIGATSPAQVPLTGYYAYKVDSQAVGWSRTKYRVEVLNVEDIHG